MRRVRLVRITITGVTVECEACGLGHRVPCARVIPLHTALALRAAGVPTVVCSRPAGRRRGGR